VDCVEGMFSDGEVIPFSHENFDRLAKVPQIKATHRRVASKRFISRRGTNVPHETIRAVPPINASRYHDDKTGPIANVFILAFSTLQSSREP